MQKPTFIFAHTMSEARDLMRVLGVRPADCVVINSRWGGNICGYHDIDVNVFLGRASMTPQMRAYLDAIGFRFIFHPHPVSSFQSQYQGNWNVGGSQQMSIKCRIWWQVDTQSYVLNCTPGPQLKSFVTLLKSAVPAGDRDYDPKTYFWYFKEVYGDGVRALAQSIFGMASVSFISRQASEQAQQNRPIAQSSTSMRDVWHEFTSLTEMPFGNEVIEYKTARGYYRAASLRLHPDRNGGDGAKQARLNELWGRIEHEHYHK